ncbi:MAG: hypothetical protein CTY31_10670 [Hyphomicrobium sp.]|nr:MAG: hypothetical protein CTY31_10670 [Hyphomicrobium sp.]
MKGHFHSIVGWEKFAGQWLLRMKLAEPELKTVWPGPPSADRPYGETRLLRDEILTVGDVTRAVSDEHFRRKHGYNDSDIKLLWHALGLHPGNNRGGRRPRPQPGGPVP